MSSVLHLNTPKQVALGGGKQQHLLFLLTRLLSQERREKMRHEKKTSNLYAIHYKCCLPPLPSSPPPHLFQVFLWSSSLDHFCFLSSSSKQKVGANILLYQLVLDKWKLELKRSQHLSLLFLLSHHVITFVLCSRLQGWRLQNCIFSRQVIIKVAKSAQKHTHTTKSTCSSKSWLELAYYAAVPRG